MEFGTQNQLFGLADLVGDYKFGGPPGPVPMSQTVKDKILDLWLQGKGAGQIRDLVPRQDRQTRSQRRCIGQKYCYDRIYHVVLCAREEGDPRAVRRRG